MIRRCNLESFIKIRTVEIFLHPISCGETSGTCNNMTVSWVVTPWQTGSPLISDFSKTTHEHFTKFSDYVYFIIIQLHTKFYSVATNRFKVRNLSLHLILRKNQRFFGKVDENNGKMFEWGNFDRIYQKI